MASGFWLYVLLTSLLVMWPLWHLTGLFGGFVVWCVLGVPLGVFVSVLALACLDCLIFGPNPKPYGSPATPDVITRNYLRNRIYREPPHKN